MHIVIGVILLLVVGYYLFGLLAGFLSGIISLLFTLGVIGLAIAAIVFLAPFVLSLLGSLFSIALPFLPYILGVFAVLVVIGFIANIFSNSDDTEDDREES